MAVGRIQHFLARESEAHSHPDPVFRMRLLDANIVDQEGTRIVILDLDQAFGQELREGVDERIGLQDPAAHFSDRQSSIGYAFAPVPVQQVFAIRFQITVQRIDPVR
jgi:hypothetical protein